MDKNKKVVGPTVIDLLKRVRGARGLNNAWAVAVDRAIETKDTLEKNKPQRQHMREPWTGW